MGEIVFVTYGDSGFRRQRNLLQKMAQDINLFDKVIIKTEDIQEEAEMAELLKNNSGFQNVFKQRRGGGYWIWKPYIIYSTLKALNNNDILVYTDSGSYIPNYAFTKNKMKEYFDRVRNYDKGLICLRNNHDERLYCKGDIFEYFGVYNEKRYTHSRQHSGGRLHVIRKCSYSMNFYKKWWDIAQEHPEFFDDSPSTKENLPGFIENRHDQSVWSLLCKTHDIKQETNFNDIPIGKHVRKLSETLMGTRKPADGKPIDINSTRNLYNIRTIPP